MGQLRLTGQGQRRELWVESEGRKGWALLGELPGSVWGEGEAVVALPGHLSPDPEAPAPHLPQWLLLRLPLKEPVILHLRVAPLTSGNSSRCSLSLTFAPRIWFLSPLSASREWQLIEPASSHFLLSVPCGRLQDQLWVTAVAFITALLGAAMLFHPFCRN